MTRIDPKRILFLAKAKTINDTQNKFYAPSKISAKCLDKQYTRSVRERERQGGGVGRGEGRGVEARERKREREIRLFPSAIIFALRATHFLIST